MRPNSTLWAVLNPSGVVHAGIYYTPGSLKAQFCREGVAATVAFCRDNDIPVDQCGKLIVATNDAEHGRMLDLYERAQENGLDVELLDAAELTRREPNIVGIGAIFLNTTAISDYAAIAGAMAVSKDGSMIDDFLFRETDRSLHVCSAPSPAATSAIPIGRYICDRLLDSQ